MNTNIVVRQANTGINVKLSTSFICNICDDIFFYVLCCRNTHSDTTGTSSQLQSRMKGFNCSVVCPRSNVPSCSSKSLTHLHHKNLDRFFDDPAHFGEMYDIVTKRDAISLRMCEFICTDMACDGLVLERLDGTNIYLDAVYKNMLHSKGKVMFDVFRRNKKTLFMLDKHGRSLQTNLAQVRFFQFAITTGVIRFARANFRMIESLMSRATVLRQKRNRTKTTRRPSKKVKVKAHAYTGNSMCPWGD